MDSLKRKTVKSTFRLRVNYFALLFHIILTTNFTPLASIGFFICVMYELFDRSAYVSSIAPEASAKVLLKRKPEKISVFTNNTCLMPEGLSRENNLPFTTDRATLI